MTTFDDRDNTFENKFAHDEKMMFKVIARRNKLLGMWAAEKLGKTGADAEKYALDVVESDFEKPGDEDVVEKLMKDFETAGKTVTTKEVRVEIEKFFQMAKKQVLGEGK